MSRPVVFRLHDIQSLPNITSNVIIRTEDPDNLMVIVSGHVDNALFGRLSEQLSFLTLCVLPGVLDNKWCLWVSLAMCLPASRCPAGYATRPHHQSVDDEPLRRTIPLNLNKALAIFRNNCGIEPKLFLIHPEKSENRGHELQAIFVNVEPFRCDSP
jgi:hypothetical protein